MKNQYPMTGRSFKIQDRSRSERTYRSTERTEKHIKFEHQNMRRRISSVILWLQQTPPPTSKLMTPSSLYFLHKSKMSMMKSWMVMRRVLPDNILISSSSSSTSEEVTWLYPGSSPNQDFSVTPPPPSASATRVGGLEEQELDCHRNLDALGYQVRLPSGRGLPQLWRSSIWMMLFPQSYLDKHPL